MRIFLLIAIPLLLLSFPLAVNAQVVDDSISNDKIEPKEDNIYSIGDKVIIGDSKTEDFKPTVELSKWGECFLSVTYPTVKSIEPSIIGSPEGEKLLIDIDLFTDLYVYPVKDARFPDALEFEIVLVSKPKSNVIALDMDFSGLVLTKQPPLTEVYTQDRCVEFWGKGRYVVTETTVFNSSGSVMAHSPEWNVNSYVAYHETKRNNEYNTGKAFHIPREELIDVFGNRARIENLNYENGQLLITLPQDFLDSASYPIRHATGLIFGYSAAGVPIVGGSLFTTSSNFIHASGDTYNPSYDTYIDSMSVYLDKSGFNPIAVRLCLYDDTVFVEDTDQISSTSATPQWYTENMSDVTIAYTATDYYLAIFTDNPTITYYDVVASNGFHYYNGAFYPAWPDPIAWSVINVPAYYWELSVYATYTTPFGAEDPRHSGVIGGPFIF